MRALSIRQPYAELILRGVKTAELRSRRTSVVGERFYIYAARARARVPIWSADLRAGGAPPAWLVELAEQVGMIPPGELAGLPTGVIVGSAVIERVTPPEPGDADALFRWHLVDVERAKRLRKPTGHPQPVWFRPFR